MDKYEYKVRSEEISKLIDQEKYTEAVKIADTIDWRRVKSATMLLKISALYRVNRRNEDGREMLMLAYERYPTNRSVVYSLCELSIELDDVVSAIEYYKQYVKLAPKDNGVYTLRYRILEAQEASLEERIEILEELKKKDYQEEWAYELAYLYHRVGLSTKCVEECDDIVLWFGDGPYVMKAMELKAVHVPLSESQQEKYQTMRNNASDNYSGDANESYNQGIYSLEDYGTEDTEYYQESYTNETYEDTEYSQEGYTEYGQENYLEENYENYPEQLYNNGGYDGQQPNLDQGYENNTYDTQNYANESYGDSAYDTQSYSDAGYQNNGYDTQNYPKESYGDSAYDTQSYLDTGYENNGYDTQNYPKESYGDSTYDTQNYPDAGYENNGYDTQNYSEESYGNTEYAQENYNGEQFNTAAFPQENYSDYGQNSYVDDGYGNLHYTDSNGYTDKFYVEQTYDENGNLIVDRNDTNFYEDTKRGGEPDRTYRNGLYLYQNNPGPATNAGDMSQYNTINLQKVVAESMKELFAEDEDVFAEDREKYNSSEDVNNIARRTHTYNSIYDKSSEEFGQEPESMTYTNTIAQLVTSVSESPPGPNTGAIRKVYIPGKDARLVKSDSDIKELRDTTEQSVNEEHNRMENNEENVYHDQNILEAGAGLDAQITGTMNLNDVLAEWERKKTENAKKHQEEIKKRVLTQTGKIFAEFDNSLKSGILGEIQREEEAAQRRIPRKDRFLEADVTGDILQNQQRQASEDAFDVEYRTEQAADRKEISDVREEYQPDFENMLEQEPEIAEPLKENNVGSNMDYMPPANEDLWESDEAYQAENSLESGNEYQTENDLQSDDAYTAELELPNSTQYLPENNPESGAQYTQEINLDDAIIEDDTNLEDSFTQENDDTFSQDYEQEETEDNFSYEQDSDEYQLEEDKDSSNAYEDNEISEGILDSDGYDNTYEVEENNVDNLTEDYNNTQEIYSYENSDELPQESNTELEIEYADYGYAEEASGYTQELYQEETYPVSDRNGYRPNYQYDESQLDPEDAESIAEMAKEDALKTQEIKMNTADLSSLSEKIVATTKKEARGAKREELREFTAEEQTLFENFAVTKKIKKQIIFALENMTLAAYTGNVIITGDAGLDTVRMAKNLIKKYQVTDENFSGRLAKITGEKINQRNIKDVFEKLNNGGIIIEKANGMSEEKLYEMTLNLNQENLGIVVIMEDTKKEISKLLQKQAMIADYFNIRIDLMEMDNNALVAYAKNYALALEYSIDELGTLALYTRIANMQSGNHVVTKDEVRDIIDEAIWKSRKSKLKNFVDVLFARRYDNEDMIVLKERDFI